MRLAHRTHRVVVVCDDGGDDTDDEGGENEDTEGDWVSSADVG